MLNNDLTHHELDGLQELLNDAWEELISVRNTLESVTWAGFDTSDMVAELTKIIGDYDDEDTGVAAMIEEIDDYVVTEKSDNSNG